jgi:hypothetical protein
MTSRKSRAGTTVLADQLNATLVGGINQARIADELVQQARQDAAWQRAAQEIDMVRIVIGSPERILGNPGTKHGEIAEQVEVGVRRARDLLAETAPGATFDGVGRTDAVDYRIDGIDVQSKFINGSNSSLNHVLKHMEKYQDFGRDGSFYHIPKDQYDQIVKVMHGDTGDLSAKSVRAILDKVEKIQEETGRTFDEVVRPSVSTHGEVQQGQVHKTLDTHEDDLKNENKALKDQIAREHGPSVSEGLRAVVGAGAVGAAVGFASAVFGKYREGKNIFKGEFTRQDWKEVGVDALKGGAVGAVSGGALYALTNCAGMSAPFAGAFVSAVKGLAPLVQDYSTGKISLDTLVDEGMFVCSDIAIVGICTAIGQAAIPVPILGAVIGSIAGKVLSSCLGNKVRAARARIEARMQAALDRLDDSLRKKVAALVAKVERLGALTKIAFDVERNTALLVSSVTLAREYGIGDARLLKSTAEVDAYFLG